MALNIGGSRSERALVIGGGSVFALASLDNQSIGRWAGRRIPAENCSSEILHMAGLIVRESSAVRFTLGACASRDYAVELM